MISYGGSRIVRTVTVDDGTTGGKEVLIDENGKQWVRTSSTRDACGTGEIVGTLTGGRIWT